MLARRSVLPLRAFDSREQFRLLSANFFFAGACCDRARPECSLARDPQQLVKRFEQLISFAAHIEMYLP